MNRILTIAVFGMAALTGCAFNTTNTPGGKNSNGMIAAGLVSWNNTDTKVAFEDCRMFLEGFNSSTKPDTAMANKENYATCWNNGMKGVAPNGQRTDPVPVDLNGDNQPDAVRYPDGVQIPYGLYMTYPGVYWPGQYQHYSVAAPHARLQRPHFYGHTTFVPPAPLGESERAGSVMDPRMAQYAQANANRPTPAAAAPAPATDATAEKLDKVVKHLKLVQKDVKSISDDMDETKKKTDVLCANAGLTNCAGSNPK